MPLTREELGRLNWRQLGFQIHEAETGSNPNLYNYAMLIAEAKRRCDREIVSLNPPDIQPIEGNIVLPSKEKIESDIVSPSKEKIADMTHRGKGL